MEETLKQILNELKELKSGQQELRIGQEELRIDVADLKTDRDKLKDHLINGLGPYFQKIENHIDSKTLELKSSLEDQQQVIDTLAVRSIKHESEIKDLRRVLNNQ